MLFPILLGKVHTQGITLAVVSSHRRFLFFVLHLHPCSHSSLNKVRIDEDAPFCASQFSDPGALDVLNLSLRAFYDKKRTGRDRPNPNLTIRESPRMLPKGLMSQIKQGIAQKKRPHGPKTALSSSDKGACSKKWKIKGIPTLCAAALGSAHGAISRRAEVGSEKFSAHVISRRHERTVA